MGFTLHTKKQVYDLDKKTLIMGILNVTPDSFSDGGKFSNLDKAVEQAAAMERDGADIIDIGGESTRPGHEPVSEHEELERVLPVIKKLSSVLTIPVSIDTYKAEVARQAVEVGADIINDVWGAKRDAKMAEVAANLNVPIILMHNRTNKEYHNLIEDMKKDLKESITIAKDAGVQDENIILDPGIGFAKNHDDNLVVMRHLDSFQELNYPMLLATSRKRFIGQILDLPVEERMEGTGATVCLGISKGVHMVRVHDVKPVARMAKMMDAMVGKGE